MLNDDLVNDLMNGWPGLGLKYCLIINQKFLIRETVTTISFENIYFKLTPQTGGMQAKRMVHLQPLPRYPNQGLFPGAEQLNTKRTVRAVIPNHRHSVHFLYNQGHVQIE